LKKFFSLKRTLLWVLVFTSSAVVHAAEGLHQKTAEELVGEGNRLVKEGLYRESARFYKKAYDDYQSTDAIFNLALVYDRYLNLDRKAVIYYRKFLELVPEDPDKERILEWIAAAEQDQSNVTTQKKYSIASKYVLTGTEASPYINEANQALKELKYRYAIDQYKRAIIMSNSAAACYNLALVYDLDLEFYAKAIYYYQKYLVLDPKSEFAEKVTKRIEQAKQALNNLRKAVPSSRLFSLRGPK